MNTHSTFYLSATGLSASQFGHNLLQSLRKWQAQYRLKIQVRNERRELATLPDYLLKDIGVSRLDALREVQREFDDLPTERLKGIVN